jgi:hypothetical protein
VVGRACESESESGERLIGGIAFFCLFFLPTVDLYGIIAPLLQAQKGIGFA